MEPTMKQPFHFPAKGGTAPLPRQGGAVLIVSLLVLLVMTIIGVTAMQTTTFEEMMAGNMRDRNLAFQAAETAMRDAETLIAGAWTTAVFNGTGGLYGENDTDPDYDATPSPWTGGSSVALGSPPSPSSATISGVFAQPSYYIRLVGTDGSRNIGVYGSPRGVTTFRITARGVGGTSAAQVHLQSYYGRIFQ